MLLSARLLVVFSFLIFGASFVAISAVFYYEFQDSNWFEIGLLYSHLFLFFPTFGIIALIAFYYPSAVLVDIYWRHVPLGVLRFCLGFVIVAAASYAISTQILKGDVGTLWGVKPEILARDKGQPTGCDSTQASCLRVPVLEALTTLHLESQNRVGLRPFVRNCNPDALLETPESVTHQRYCFVTQSKQNAEQCCRAQQRFADTMRTFYTPENNRSFTEKFHSFTLPIYIFFLLVLLIIGLLLAIRRRQVDRDYPNYVGKVERGLIVGAFVMLIWPVTNLGFIQSNRVLYGPFTDGIYTSLTPIISLIFGAWALMLLFFFFRRFEKDLEAVGKIAGVIVSAFAILKYEEIIDYSVRIAGSGASYMTLGLLAGLACLALLILFFGKKAKLPNKSQARQSEAMT